MVGLALSQASVSTLLLIAVALFSEKSTPISGLQRKSKLYLEHTLRNVLAEASVPKRTNGAVKERAVRVKIIANSSTTATYNVSIENDDSDFSSLSTVIYLNVNRCQLFFYVPPNPDQTMEKLQEDVARDFIYEIKNASKFGLKFYERIGVEEIGDAEFYYVFCYSRKFSKDFLETPSEQLSFAQDYARLVRSFLMTSNRYRVRLAVKNVS